MTATTGNHSAAKAQTNGVLPVSASQTAGNTPKNTSNKSSGPRMKVVIRRLAPGLTEAEFVKIMGEEWKQGQGKIDWFSYKPGKDSKDQSKPSRPSRAYLHLTGEEHLLPLSETVRQRSFEDAANTFNNPALLGPPSVEFAPYGRVPSGRRRVDARQGTIDQDPEFMDFLESLANPVSTKENVDEGEGGPSKGEKVTTTPLVQFLKDKKANKSKEAAASKAAKHARQDSQAPKGGSKSKEAAGPSDDSKKSGKESKKDRLVEKAAREAVKVLNREAANKAGGGAVSGGGAQESSKNPRAQARERGSIAAAARILQRDLGLSPGVAHRKAKADADNAAKVSSDSSSSQASSSPATGKGPANKSRGGRATSTNENDKISNTTRESPAPAPIVLLKKPSEAAVAPSPQTPPPAPTSNKAGNNAPPRKAQAAATPSAGATKAFVKHANPSQGVTEALLKEAMEVFGAVSHVEIDKRKGFAYVDFAEPEGLIKAMAANPTKIAQGTVQVLERKDARPARETTPGPSTRGTGFPGRGGRGGTVGRRGGRGEGRGRGGAGGGSASSDATASPAANPAPSPTVTTAAGAAK